MKAPVIKAVRCAIYTRVSTDHGLDQEFNSLDAQYDAASAYIKSQAHAGWTLIRSRYDDGGYSGGSTDRPEGSKGPFWFQKLPRFRGYPRVLGRRSPAAGNGIFGCRDRWLKSAGETANVAGDRKCGTIAAEIPTETARFDSAWKSAVW